MALPTSGGYIVYGGGGYLFLEERASTGAALGTPDTAHKVSIIGNAKITRKPTTDLSTKVTIKSNQGVEFTATQAEPDSSGSSTTAPDIEITFNLQESSIDHLDFYAAIKGKYFVLTLPMGARGDKYVDASYFAQIEDGGDTNLDGDKPTEITVKAKVLTNSVAITAAVPASPCHAAAISIAQYAGYKLTGTDV